MNVHGSLVALIVTLVATGALGQLTVPSAELPLPGSLVLNRRRLRPAAR